jgi:hypothetical protein
VLQYKSNYSLFDSSTSILFRWFDARFLPYIIIVQNLYCFSYAAIYNLAWNCPFAEFLEKIYAYRWPKLPIFFWLHVCLTETFCVLWFMGSFMKYGGKLLRWKFTPQNFQYLRLIAHLWRICQSNCQGHFLNPNHIDWCRIWGGSSRGFGCVRACQRSMKEE